MVIFLALHPMESISLNSFVLLEHLAMLLTSTLAINCLLINFAKMVSEYDQEIPQSQTTDNPMAPREKAKHFLNFNDDTMI